MWWDAVVLQLLLIATVITAISYRCDGDRILIVQSFGNNTIRMHCQTLNICGNTNLRCRYEGNQPHCGGKDNFVAHVEQNAPSEPVIHKCCQVESTFSNVKSIHDGNECFVYELPDGATESDYSNDPDVNETEVKLLSANINYPKIYNTYEGYRLRLFLLKSKSKAKLLVKGIERKGNGYRVTICHPWCSRTIDENSSQHGNRDFIDKRKLTSGSDWIIATWSAWSSSKWTQWSRSDWNNNNGATDVRVRGGEIKTKNTPLAVSSNTISKPSETRIEWDKTKNRFESNETSDKIATETVNQNGIHGTNDSHKKAVVGGQKSNVDSDNVKSKGQETFNRNQSEYSNLYNSKTNSGTGGAGEDKIQDGITRKGLFSIVENGGVKEQGSQTGSFGIKDVNREDSRKQEEETGNATFRSITEDGNVKEHSYEKGFNFTELSDKKEGKVNKTTGEKGSPSLESKTRIGSDEISSEQLKPIDSEHQEKNTLENKGMKEGGGEDNWEFGVTAEVGNGEADNNTLRKPQSKEYESKPEEKEEKQGTNVDEGETANSAAKNLTIGTDSFAKSNTPSDSSVAQAKPPVGDGKGNTVNMATATLNSNSAKNGAISSTLSSLRSTNIAPARNPPIINPPIANASVANAISGSQIPTKAGADKISDTTTNATGNTTITSRTGLGGNLTLTRTGARSGGIMANNVANVAARTNTVANSGRANGASGAATGAARRNCFSGDSKVQTPSGEVLMSELKVGDLVLVPASGNLLKYERVEMFYHREPDTRTKFIVLLTESGKTLSLTELHLLPIGECDKMATNLHNIENVEEIMRGSLFAYKARKGDCVLSITDNGELKTDKVLKITRKYAKGIYAPITVEGSLLADGILASCFSHLESHFIQKLAHDFYVRIYSTFGSLMNSIYDPIQHLPVYVESLHELSRYILPFAKY